MGTPRHMACCRPPSRWPAHHLDHGDAGLSTISWCGVRPMRRCVAARGAGSCAGPCAALSRGSVGYGAATQVSSSRPDPPLSTAQSLSRLFITGSSFCQSDLLHSFLPPFTLASTKLQNCSREQPASSTSAALAVMGVRVLRVRVLRSSLMNPAASEARHRRSRGRL